MATNYNPRECGVCQEEFDEGDRCPRTLPCSHHLCSDCINGLIRNYAPKCPFCRQDFQANTAKDMIISTVVLDFIKFMSLQKSVTNKDMINALKEEISKTGNEISHICHGVGIKANEALARTKYMKETLDLENAKFIDVIIPKIHAIIEINNTKKSSLDILELKVRNYMPKTEHEKSVQDVNEKLNAVSTFKDAAALLTEAEGIKTTIDEWADDFKKLGEKVMSVEKEVKEGKTNHNSLMDVLSLQHEQEILGPHIEEVPIIPVGPVPSTPLREYYGNIPRRIEEVPMIPVGRVPSTSLRDIYGFRPSRVCRYMP